MEGQAGRDIDAGQDLLVDLELEWDGDGPEAAAALGLDPGLEPGSDDDPAIGPRQPQMTLDRVRETPVILERDGDPGQLVIAGGATRLGEETGDIEGERLDRQVICHQRAGSDASSRSSSSGSSDEAARPAPAAIRRSSSVLMPFLMLWRVRIMSPSSPIRTAAAYSLAPRRISAPSAWAAAMIWALCFSAVWVSPRSSIRKAACSWARPTVRSASFCAPSR